MAVDYAAFLRQTPWYQYPFNAQGARAVGGAGRARRSRMGEASRHRPGVRGEGRLREGHRRRGRRHRAGAAGRSAASSSGLDAAALARIAGRQGRSAARGTASRSRRRATTSFTRILADIARQGGTIREIAGNDEIMVSVTVREGATCQRPARNRHPAHEARRHPRRARCSSTSMPELAAFLKAYPRATPVSSTSSTINHAQHRGGGECDHRHHVGHGGSRIETGHFTDEQLYVRWRIDVSEALADTPVPVRARAVPQP